MQATAIPVAEGDIHAAVPDVLSAIVKGGRRLGLTTSPLSVSLNVSQSYGSPRPVARIAFPFTIAGL
jgi:hypothetical protein